MHILMYEKYDLKLYYIKNVLKKKNKNLNKCYNFEWLQTNYELLS